MVRAALTGGIATGKSYVLARLRDRGIPTIDADAIVHEALGPGTPATHAIAAKFGSEFLNGDGSINRSRVGAKVFRDAEARHQIEAITHPVVWTAIRRWFDALDGPVGVACIPLLYETQHEGEFDFVAATFCPPELQLQRIVERDRLSVDAAMQRISAQMPAEEKARRADFVIQTGGTMADTNRQVDELIIALR